MFISTLLLTVLSWCAVQGALVPRSHVVHEKRHLPPASWAKRDKIGPLTVLPVRIGLKQRNLDKLDDLLMEVSHPRSPKYGKHWKSEEVIQMFAPSEDTVSIVREWLIANNIPEARITHSDNRGWLAFDAVAEEIETLLYTQYHEYEHEDTGDISIACDRYHLPKHIKDHVDYITPGLRLISRSSLKGRGAGRPNSLAPNVVAESKPAPRSSSGNDLGNCDQVIIPGCIAALYQIPPGNLSDPSNALGIFEWNSTYAQEDLDTFFKNLAPQIPQGTHPTPAFIDGATAPAPLAEAGTEAELDFQISYPILWPQGTVLYQTDDRNYSSNMTSEGIFNDFLDAIDGSYCTFSAYGETGNDPNIDPIYPDPKSGGYKGKLQCGVYKPTNVVSISYGSEEDTLPAYYQKRQCLEFAKLGLQGVSIIIASGDDGVSGRGQRCLGPENAIFNPNWPVNCPYVTAVGATEIPLGKTVHDPEVAAQKWVIYPQFEYEGYYCSGGGFSNLYGTPKYQKDAVDYYFKNYNPPYPYYCTSGTVPLNGTGVYNRIGRGMPDVSAIGLNVTVYFQGEPLLADGTSASAPLFASVITRIIEERIAVGKGPLGFLNPVLYANPQIFNDITQGTNPGCQSAGFSAAPGWDPVTGLGSPNYPKMLDLFLSLE